MMRIRPKVKVPGAMLTGLFFDALSSIRCFPDFPDPFSTLIRMPANLMMQTQKQASLTLVLLDWSQAGRFSAPLRHALNRTLSLLRHRRRAIARGPEAATLRLIGSLSGFRCFRALAIHCTPLSEIV